MNLWATALLMGLTGSLHCIWMCGPLVIGATSTQPAVLINKTLYNGGRIFTYSILGALAGTAGLMVNLAGWSKVLSITLGVGLIVLAFAGITQFAVPGFSQLLKTIHTRLKHLFGIFLNQRTKSGMVLMGMLNGLLPCGLTYIALAYTLTLDPVSGFLFMMIFGIATLPAMLGLTALLHGRLSMLRVDVKKVTVSVMIISGILLLTRADLHFGHDALRSPEITVCGK